MLLPISLFAQVSPQDSFLITKLKGDYSLITSQLTKAQDISEQFISAFSLDVFTYYNLSNVYDTELKKSLFKETNEYKEKLTNLKQVKKEYLSTCLYLDITKSKGFEISDYDLVKGGVIINFGYEKKAILNVFFDVFEIKSIPFKIQQSNIYTSDYNYDRTFFFTVPKTDALELENNLESLKCLIIFKPGGVKESIRKEDLGGYIYNYKDQFITMDLVRVILINPNTNKIFIDKNFKIAKK